MKPVSALDSLDDKMLLTLIASSQDKLALAELYDRYRHGLGSFIRRNVYQDKLVEEIYNDVMLAIWHQASGFRGDSKVSTWVFGIAHHMCMSQSRKELKHTKNMTDVEFDDLQAEPNKAESASENESELLDQLRTATSKLGDKHRIVIELTYFQGHSMLEIAEIINCPVSTVKTRLFQARQKLKARLNKSTNN